MKRCINCNRNISDRGNRATRCGDCQKEFRKHKDDDINKKRGTIRRTAELNQWAKYIPTLTQQDKQDLITCYRNQLKGATGREALDIRTRIKILDDSYIPNELKETIKEVDHDAAILPHSEQIDWDAARTGWTQYYDDGVVTLSPEVFFRKKKVDQ